MEYYQQNNTEKYLRYLYHTQAIQWSLHNYLPTNVYSWCFVFIQSSLQYWIQVFFKLLRVTENDFIEQVK